VAKHESANVILIRRLKEISFLKNFQEKIHRDREEETNYKLAGELIKKEFPLKYLAIVEGTKKNKVHYSYPTKAPIPSLPLLQSSGISSTSGGYHSKDAGGAAILSPLKHGFQGSFLRRLGLTPG
jgi:hypothetical protein